jgi:hypothetical protein
VNILLLESPQKRIRSTIARRAKLEDRAVREQLTLLKRLRRDILTRLANAEGFQIFRLQSMLAIVDTEMRNYARTAERATAAVTRGSFAAGRELATITSGLPEQLWGVSPQLLTSVIDVTTDQSRAVWGELGSKLKAEIRRVTLGVEDPFEAMGKVAKLIKDPKTFGRAFTRAEAIVRTETNRVFSMAAHGRSNEADKALKLTGQRVMKYWLTAEDDRVRPTHYAAGKRYTADRPIPLDEPFLVGGEELMFPQDPAGSAAETINCRCVPLHVVVSLEQFEILAKAA